MIDVLEEKKTRKRNLIFWGIVLAVALIYTGYVLVQVHDVNVYINVQHSYTEFEIIEEKNPFTKYWFLKAGEAIDAAPDYVGDGRYKHGGVFYWVFGIQKGDAAPIFCYYLDGRIEQKVISGVVTTTTLVARKAIPLGLRNDVFETIGWYKD
ncbi:MAG: hypothetical protein E7223_00775 [Clostridiales bacterium]|nr:hypothetical protein [Clostridiales bacterium]